MRKILRTIPLALLGFSFSAILACSSDSSPSAPQPPPQQQQPVLTISVSADSIVLAPGDSSSVTATYTVPASYTGSVTVSASNAPAGVILTIGNAPANTALYKLAAEPTAQPGSSYMRVRISGLGATGAVDSVLVRVIP